MANTQETGRITDEVLTTAFDQYRSIYRGESGHGQDMISAFAKMVGDDDSYNALIAAADIFIASDPEIFEGRVVAPHVVALWTGLVVGASVRKLVN